jgi:hypothetical protein
MQRAEVESSVESVRERARVSGCVLAERESEASAAEAGLQVTEYPVDPLEFGHLLVLATTDDDRFMAGTEALTARMQASPSACTTVQAPAG